MTARVRSGALLALVILAIVLSAAGLILHLVARSSGAPGLSGLPTTAAQALGGVMLTVLGTLIVRRLPGNVIGWAFLAAGLGLCIGELAQSHVAYSFASENEPLPGATVAGLLVRGTLAIVVWGPIFAVLLLFPDGRLVSRRWRPLTWASTGVVSAIGMTALLAPGPLIDDLDGLRTVPDNPIGLTALADVLEFVGGLMWPAVGVCFIGAAISVVVRYRRARGVERQQLRWFVWSVSVVAVGSLLQTVGEVAYGERGLPPLLGVVATALVVGGLANLPVAVTIAILRYRLYDIDRIISRTISYGLLTAMLGVVYSVGVVGLGGVVGATSGGPREAIVVAVSTLAVAALFVPARRRIQATVDRRFNRARYDAQRIVEQFAHGLRDEVDLEALSAQLRNTASATMAPRSISMWLRAGEVAR
jgi:hypothetical protein